MAKLVFKLYKVCDLLEINLIKPIMAGRKKLEMKEVKLSRKESILIKIKAIVGEAGGTLILFNRVVRDVIDKERDQADDKDKAENKEADKEADKEEKKEEEDRDNNKTKYQTLINDDKDSDDEITSDRDDNKEVNLIQIN